MVNTNKRNQDKNKDNAKYGEAKIKHQIKEELLVPVTKHFDNFPLLDEFKDKYPAAF